MADAEAADVAWSTLVDALARVEDVAPQDAGILAFEPGSGIFVEGGRVCWAAARGMRQRLRDLLGELIAGRGVDLDRVYERCRETGTMLGETLVADGFVTSTELERVLRRHSAESLVVLCRPDADAAPVWTSRGGRGYAPRFTFRPLDVFMDVVALCVPDLQDTARAELAPLLGPERRGAAFCFTEAYDTAVPIAAFGDLTVHALRVLGQWAMHLPIATRELGATPTLTLAGTPAGDAIAVWWRGAVLYAVACSDRASVATLAAQLLARSA